MAAAKSIDVSTLSTYFESLSDPRHTRNRKHLLVDVVVVAMCAILVGMDGPTAIHRWAKGHSTWLATFLRLPNGLPSRDCIRRLLIVLKPEAFQKCFQAWISQAVDVDVTNGRRLVAIDGKCCRSSHDSSKGLGALHLVSAWASENGIALGQIATEDKSNEITAIPHVLDLIDLTKSIVTIDAIGCQKAIVEQIDEAGGAYVIAVKDNQPTLHETIREFIGQRLDGEYDDLRYRAYETTDEGHGRLDERSYGVLKIPKNFSPRGDWPSLKAVGYATRFTVHQDGTETSDTRFYILNRQLTGQRFAEAVRGHWSIEAMHWVLDVNFREDEHPTAERTLANNLSWMRRFAITLLKRKQTKNESLRGLMQMASWDTDFLEQVLTGT